MNKGFKIILIFGIFGFLLFLSIFSFYQNKSSVFKILGFDNNQNKQEVQNEGKAVKDFSEIVELSEKSLIRISFMSKDNKRSLIGVGTLIENDVMISNQISSSKDQINVLDYTDRKYDIKNLISDKEKLLSFIKLKSDTKITNKFKNNTEIKLGDEVYFLGYDKNETKVVKRGIVSKISNSGIIPDFEIKDILGGVLFDIDGKTIGVLSGNSIFEFVQNQSFYSLNRDKLEKELKPGFLGIGFDMKNLKDYINKAEPIGPIITGVVVSSPASEMGIKKDDILISINGKEMDSEESLESFISGSFAGDDVTVKVFRKGSTLELKGRFGEKTD